MSSACGSSTGSGRVAESIGAGFAPPFFLAAGFVEAAFFELFFVPVFFAAFLVAFFAPAFFAVFFVAFLALFFAAFLVVFFLLAIACLESPERPPFFIGESSART